MARRSLGLAVVLLDILEAGDHSPVVGGHTQVEVRRLAGSHEAEAHSLAAVRHILVAALHILEVARHILEAVHSLEGVRLLEAVHSLEVGLRSQVEVHHGRVEVRHGQEEAPLVPAVALGLAVAHAQEAVHAHRDNQVVDDHMEEAGHGLEVVLHQVVARPPAVVRCHVVVAHHMRTAVYGLEVAVQRLCVVTWEDFGCDCGRTAQSVGGHRVVADRNRVEAARHHGLVVGARPADVLGGC